MSEEADKDKPEKKAEGIVERTIVWIEDCVLAAIRRRVDELGNAVIENILRIALCVLALALAVVFLSLSIVTALNRLMPLPVALAVAGVIFILLGLLLWKIRTDRKRR